jgi:hypothetical protein
MPSVADCLRQHAPAYLEKFGERVPLGHRKVISAITRCRTGQLGGVVYQCDDCGRQHWVGRSCGNRHTPTGEKQSRTRCVTGSEFVRGFVQHVLPRGYQKVRYYGWMSSNSRIDLDKVKWLVWLFLGWTYWLGSGHAPPEQVEPEAVRCAACGGPMKIIGGPLRLPGTGGTQPGLFGQRMRRAKGTMRQTSNQFRTRTFKPLTGERLTADFRTRRRLRPKTDHSDVA